MCFCKSRSQAKQSQRVCRAVLSVSVWHAVSTGAGRCSIGGARAHACVRVCVCACVRVCDRAGHVIARASVVRQGSHRCPVGLCACYGGAGGGGHGQDELIRVGARGHGVCPRGAGKHIGPRKAALPHCRHYTLQSGGGPRAGQGVAKRRRATQTSRRYTAERAVVRDLAAQWQHCYGEVLQL